MSKPKYIGARVRLLRDHTTRGGTIFRAGVIMLVGDHTSGGLTLSCYVRGRCYCIRSVSPHDVLILETPGAAGDKETD